MNGHEFKIIYDKISLKSRITEFTENFIYIDTYIINILKISGNVAEIVDSMRDAIIGNRILSLQFLNNDLEIIFRIVANELKRDIDRGIITTIMGNPVINNNESTEESTLGYFL